MIKVFAGICIVAFCTALGCLTARKYKRKRDFYLALEAFLQQLKREISFSNNSICRIISSAKTENEELSAALSSFCDNGTVALPDFITETERSFICSFFDKIGRSDRSNEVELIAQFYNEVKTFREEECRRCDKFTGLSARLGFFIGSIIFVMLV